MENLSSGFFAHFSVVVLSNEFTAADERRKLRELQDGERLRDFAWCTRRWNIDGRKLHITRSCGCPPPHYVCVYDKKEHKPKKDEKANRRRGEWIPPKNARVIIFYGNDFKRFSGTGIYFETKIQVRVNTRGDRLKEYTSYFQPPPQHVTSACLRCIRIYNIICIYINMATGWQRI